LDTIDIIRGYRLRFQSDPPMRHLLKVELDIRSDEVITLEVANILTCGAIIEVDLKVHGFFSPIFAVDKLERGVVYGK
jgi:hypothetical protein